MNILLPSILAAIVGLFILSFVLPKMTAWLVARIEKNPGMSVFQKWKLMNLLEPIYKPRPDPQSDGQTTYLSIIFVALVSLQHYLLLIGNSDGAKIIVAGMFAVLGIHLLRSS